MAKVADGNGDLTGRGILKFIQKNIDANGALLISDEYTAYRAASGIIRRATINHKEQYADGLTHTNTIEGFWSLVKRAWYGQHHHYSRNHIALYIAESCWKYNNRKNRDAFSTFIAGCFA